MRFLLVALLLSALLIVAGPSVATAQFKEQSADKGPRLAREATMRIKVGVIIKATGGALQRAIATAPVPAEWPEQRVSIVNEDISHAVGSVTYRTLTGGGVAKQMLVEIPRLSAGQEAHALITFEVARRALAAPTDTSLYSIPKKADRRLTINLGASPYIESRHPKIISAAKEAVTGAETDWKKVEAIYDWVHDHVTYRKGELTGAARALYEKEGDIDELVSVFVGMCRAQKIPARTVFVLGSCYAEFYLEDDDGEGHWFPCQPAGERSFGEIDDVRPILQKGDRYKTPEKPKDWQRYVTEYFTAAGRGNSPKVEFVVEPVAQ